MAKKGQAPSPVPVKPVVSDAQVRANTGKDWATWFAALDKVR